MDASMAINEKSLSVLMFPWLGHGHVSPFLELAKKLVTRNFIIFLCSTPANLKSIKQKLINENLTQKIHLIEIHLPCLTDLPPHYHTTNGLPPHLMSTLKKAFAMSRPIFTQILNAIEPDLLLYDLLQPWAPKVAAEKNIPSVCFVTSSATMFSYMFHNFQNPNLVFPYPSIYYRDYELARMIKNKDLESIEQQKKDDTSVKLCFKRSSNIVLIKGFKELDGKYCDYISSLTNKRVVPVGPLVQEPTSDVDNSLILKWLNQKSKGSTVFVSFGSEYFLSQEDREEIAHGLEQSRVNFVWVVRFPKGEKLKLEQALPLGFFKKVGERGMVVEDWAPQAKILAHPNIGGFVSHCGWNSVMESMKIGVPIIAMPMHLDQPLNARLVEEVGVGLEVVRDKNGKLERETISQVINKVVLGKEGEPIRAKAKKMSATLGVKGDEEIDDVVQELVKLCKKSKSIRCFNLF
ncbi:UDP-glucosyltransferase 29-like [Capsicum annuum]